MFRVVSQVLHALFKPLFKTCVRWAVELPTIPGHWCHSYVCWRCLWAREALTVSVTVSFCPGIFMSLLLLFPFVCISPSFPNRSFTILVIVTLRPLPGGPCICIHRRVTLVVVLSLETVFLIQRAARSSSQLRYHLLPRPLWCIGTLFASCLW